MSFDMPTPEDAEDARAEWDTYAQEEGYADAEAMRQAWERDLHEPKEEA